MSFSFFCSFQLDWVTMTGRLLGPTTCLPHKDEGIPLSDMPKDTTSKLAGLFSTLNFCAERQAGKLSLPYLKSLGRLELENEPQVYQLSSRYSNHNAIAPVAAWPS